MQVLNINFDADETIIAEAGATGTLCNDKLKHVPAIPESNCDSTHTDRFVKELTKAHAKWSTCLARTARGSWQTS